MHAHTHSHHPSTKSPAFGLAVALNLLFVALEVLFGLRAHSVVSINYGLALVGDGTAWLDDTSLEIVGR